MSRFLLGCLALFALALMVGQAVAGASNEANNLADNNGVLIIETYTASAVVPAGNNNKMQPLPDNPGVEVAPVDSSVAQPVLVEEDMLIQETEAGE